MWRQICHLEKFLHIRNVETICFVLIYAVLSQNQFVLPFTLFCREINFVAIYAFLRGEKFRQKLCLWRKKDKYQVCSHLQIFTRELRERMPSPGMMVIHDYKRSGFTEAYTFSKLYYKSNIQKKMLCVLSKSKKKIK